MVGCQVLPLDRDDPPGRPGEGNQGRSANHKNLAIGSGQPAWSALGPERLARLFSDPGARVEEFISHWFLQRLGLRHRRQGWRIHLTLVFETPGRSPPVALGLGSSFTLVCTKPGRSPTLALGLESPQAYICKIPGSRAELALHIDGAALSNP